MTEQNPEPICRYRIPLNLKIPPPKALCPFLNKSRKHFYVQIKRGVYLQCWEAGARQGPGDVFGPSVCDAKFGCDCGLRPLLEKLRAKLKRKDL